MEKNRQSDKKESFRTFLKSRISEGKPIFFDGGMGTMIQSTGVTGYHQPEELNFTNPEIIKSIHSQYLASGSHVITTNSFGLNTIKGAESNLSIVETATAAVMIARSAIDEFQEPQKQTADILDTTSPRFVAFDMSQTGRLLEPMGTLTFDDAYNAFVPAFVAAEKAGADLILIETMSDLYETKAAILAARENTSLPIIVSMTFQPNLRTLTGADVLTCVTYLESLRVDAIGFNCGGSLKEASELTSQFCKYSILPIIAQPNAGLPSVENGRTVFKVAPDEFSGAQLLNLKQGVSILGGCCGTTPNHIAAMVSVVAADNANSKAISMELHKENEKKKQIISRVCSYSRTVTIGNTPDQLDEGTMAEPVIIGERINPTGKKKCRAALVSGDSAFILDEAQSQISAGACILDVNVGLPEIDEKQVMNDTIRLLQKTFDTPLQIDSSEPAVLEKAMRYYNGKPLVNSVNGKQKTMDAVFPLIKKYGGCVVALCLDENGIPSTALGRIAIARKVITEAEKYGIPHRDIFIDALTLTISSQQKEALETLRVISTLKTGIYPFDKQQKTGDDELPFDFSGVKTVLGVSNISFGLPRREIINSHFLSMALFSGLDACIINPLSSDMMNSFHAYKAVAGFDRNCLQYIETYSGTASSSSTASPSSIASPSSTAAPANVVKTQTGAVPNSNTANAFPETSESSVDSLKNCIIRGYSDKSAELTHKLLEAGTETPLGIIDNCIVPALDVVGKDYESGRKFLPQLLLSADTVSKAFEIIKAYLAASGEKRQSKGKILMATVHGDIHDIGKNIVKAMLGNYGYTVIDLGKDVPPEVVVETVVSQKVPLVGLSALMTTTVVSMEETIKQLRNVEKTKNLKIKVMVGGAVLTAGYAEKIGADFYTKDAMASVAVAREVFGN